MDGYDVITSDGEKIGRAVGLQGDNLIVEQGTILKSRHALPSTFVHVDDESRVVRTTISKHTLESSPKVEDGEVDDRAVSEHYGLTEPQTVYDTDDATPAADQDLTHRGAEEARRERARIRADTASGEGALDQISSPGLTGGDRTRDANP